MKLRNDGVTDWSVTLLFYTALQLIQTYFVERAVTAFDIPSGLDKRRERVRLKLWSLWVHYRDLENASQIARYDQSQPDPTDAELQEHYDQNFSVIRDQIEAELGIRLVIPS